MSKLNKNSNAYILLYAVVMTLFFGTILAFVSESLKDRQKAEVLLEKQNFILTAALGEEGLEGLSKKEITSLYEQTVKVVVVNASGDVLNVDEAKLVVAKEYKLPKEDRKLPVYIVSNKDNPMEVVSYVLPVYGSGLWDYVWAYVAVNGDLETLNGIVFDHKGETPGLGARITDLPIQQRFIGKKFMNSAGELEAPHFQKGEGIDYSADAHKVDGLSGATITAVGVNDMLDKYLEMYLPFIKAQK